MDPSLVDSVATALGIRIYLNPWWQGARADFVVDAAHAAVVERVVALLDPVRWTVRIEYSFKEDGEQGIVDVLAVWRDKSSVAIFEAKSDLGNIQETVGRLDIKSRVVPQALERELGWRPRFVAVVLVVPDAGAARRIISAHPATFGAALPARTVAVRRWLDDPNESLRGIWFLPPDASPQTRGGGLPVGDTGSGRPRR